MEWYCQLKSCYSELLFYWSNWLFLKNRKARILMMTSCMYDFYGFKSNVFNCIAWIFFLALSDSLFPYGFMYVCMYVSLSIYIYIYIFIKWNLSTWPQRVLDTRMRGWVLLLLYKWLEFGLFSTIICIYTYSIYTYAYTYTRVYVYTYIHTYMHKEIREEREEREYIYIYALPISWNHP